MEYIFKSIIKAGGQAFCFNVLLPIWYAFVKIVKAVERIGD